ncbi:Uncharacterised protein [Candidatus Ornithobacterium hominis]|uniref:Uncharacterized protein n=1 Tax=Candidatus Ornithobacterium hominis TaxID=2497989 RepID=A0A383U3N3_9FLAO|nr:Bacteriocin [Candidatus Ornithobacterium hominis]SZD73906.1 Uncharacterised protein [Candidatus Ornithobacterium hominis]
MKQLTKKELSIITGGEISPKNGTNWYAFKNNKFFWGNTRKYWE